MTFRTRIILGYSAMLVVTTASLLLSVRILLEKSTLKQLDRHHAFEAMELFHDGAPTKEARERRWSEHLRVAENMYHFMLTDADGREIFKGDDLAPVPTATLRDMPSGLVSGVPALGDCWVTAHRLDGYTLHIVTPVNESLQVVRHFEHIAVEILGVALVLALLGGALFAKWLTRPLLALESAATAIDAGTAVRIPAELASGDDEVGHIARRLNAGYARTDALIERLRFVSAEVSHELRTPLSIMRLNAERIIGRSGESGEIRELAAEQIDEIHRMKEFIGNLLAFARMDAGALPLKKEVVALDAWLADFAEDATALAEDRGLTFRIEGGDVGTVRMDRDRMRQVCLNLLSNALRHSPPGGVIVMRAGTCDDDAVELVMEDEGPGVPEEKRETIFDRYTRFEERGDAGEGFGLGLAICRAIVVLHGGAIRAANRTDRSGLAIHIRLPRDA